MNHFLIESHALVLSHHLYIDTNKSYYAQICEFKEPPYIYSPQDDNKRDKGECKHGIKKRPAAVLRVKAGVHGKRMMKGSIPKFVSWFKHHFLKIGNNTFAFEPDPVQRDTQQEPKKHKVPFFIEKKDKE